MRATALFVSSVIVTGVLSVSTGAQQRAAGQANPSDIKGVLFQLADSMGMLRGMQQEDSILTLEHWFKATIT